MTLIGHFTLNSVSAQVCLEFLSRDARSEKRGIAIVSCPSVGPYVRLSVTLMYRGRMCWDSSKLIT